MYKNIFDFFGNPNRPAAGYTGNEIADRFGFTTNKDEISKIFQDAITKGEEVNKELYDLASSRFYGNIAAQMEALQKQLAQSNAQAVNTNASQGVAAANALSLLLGASQQGVDAATSVLDEGFTQAQQAYADRVAAEKESLQYYNDLMNILMQGSGLFDNNDAMKLAAMIPYAMGGVNVGIGGGSGGGGTGGGNINIGGIEDALAEGGLENPDTALKDSLTNIFANRSPFIKGPSLAVSESDLIKQSNNNLFNTDLVASAQPPNGWVSPADKLKERLAQPKPSALETVNNIYTKANQQMAEMEANKPQYPAKTRKIEPVWTKMDKSKVKDAMAPATTVGTLALQKKQQQELQTKQKQEAQRLALAAKQKAQAEAAAKEALRQKTIAAQQAALAQANALKQQAANNSVSHLLPGLGGTSNKYPNGANGATNKPKPPITPSLSNPNRPGLGVFGNNNPFKKP